MPRKSARIESHAKQLQSQQPTIMAAFNRKATFKEKSSKRPAPPSPPIVESPSPQNEAAAGPSKVRPKTTPPPRSPPQSMSQASTTSSNGGSSKGASVMNVEALSLELSTDELVKKLKIVSTELQNMKQQEHDGCYFDQYPLFHHLAERGFLKHKSKDVRILIASCIADILRINAPEAPYKDPDEIKCIFKFLITQLTGLANVQDIAFTRCFYLLENLSFVKAFEMCFELEDDTAQDILINLFDVMLSAINTNHSEKVKLVMLDLLSPLLMDAPYISSEWLDVILKWLIEPAKSSKKAAYQMALTLLQLRADSLESHITALLNNALVGAADLEGIYVAGKIYDLIAELYFIVPSIMNGVMPQLEYKLKTLDEGDRLNAVKLLAKLFSEKDYQLYSIFKPLWQAFLGRFNDASVEIRTVCVQHSMHLMLNHPGTRKAVEDTLCSRLHDADETVRLEVVRAVVSTATNGGFEFITESEELMNCVKERTMDKKFKVRKAALTGLATIYKIHLDQHFASEGKVQRPPAWIHNRIIQGYYVDSMDDRTLVERLLNTCIVSFKMEPRARMLQLLYLCSTMNTNAFKAFVEILKNLSATRRHVLELVNCIRNPVQSDEHQTKILNSRINAMVKLMPNTSYGSENISRLVQDMHKNRASLEAIGRIVDPKSKCATVGDEVNKFLKKVGSPIMTNVYYGTVKTFLERASSVLIDTEAILSLISLVTELVNVPASGEQQYDDNLLDPAFPDVAIVIEKGCEVIATLAFLFSHHFDDPEVLVNLLNLILHDNLSVTPSSFLLSATVFVGKITRPLGQRKENFMESLVHHCVDLVDNGTPRQAKMALRCLHTNMVENSQKTEVFSKLLNKIQENLQETQRAAYGTAIVALGHFALFKGSEFQPLLRLVISRDIVKGLLMNPRRTVQDTQKNAKKTWCDKTSLPATTRCMLFAMKTMVRWLIGTKTDFQSARKTFKMLNVFVETGGGFLEEGEGASSTAPFTPSEKAWLRLTAGKCMLKLCQEKGVGDEYSALQFCTMAKLMNNEILEVRQHFAAKLHKGLSRGVPNKCLPLDFMGCYVLSAFEGDRKQKAVLKTYIQKDIKVRRDYIKMMLETQADQERAAEHMTYIMPEYMVVFAVAVLANNPHFTAYDDVCELKDMHRALLQILDLLGTKTDPQLYYFYKKIAMQLKSRVNTIDPENEDTNKRVYALCDLVLEILIQFQGFPAVLQKSDLFPLEPKISTLFFKRRENFYQGNNLSYLPEEFLSATRKTPALFLPSSQGATKSGGRQITPKRGSQQEKRKRGDEEQNPNTKENIDAEPTEPKRTRVEVEGCSEMAPESEEIVVPSSGGSKTSRDNTEAKHAVTQEKSDGGEEGGVQNANGTENEENYAPGPEIKAPVTRNLRSVRLPPAATTEAAAGGKEKQQKSKRGGKAAAKPKMRLPVKK